MIFRRWQKYAVIEKCAGHRHPMYRRHWTRRGAERTAARYTARIAQLPGLPVGLTYDVARRVPLPKVPEPVGGQ